LATSWRTSTCTGTRRRCWCRWVCSIARIRLVAARPRRKCPQLGSDGSRRNLRWLGRLWLPRVLDGEHAFLIEALGTERVRLVQRERFRGLLLPLLWRSLGGPTRRGFEDMNLALKRRVEGGSQHHAAADCERWEGSRTTGST
jgi:hypothetical protein